MKTHETLAQQEFVARQLRRRQMVVLARLFLFLSVLVLWEACARTGVIFSALHPASSAVFSPWCWMEAFFYTPESPSWRLW